MQVNTKYVISTRGTSSLKKKKKKKKSIHIAHRPVEKKRFRCLRRFHTNKHVHQSCSYSCGAYWAVMTLSCELIVFAPVYDGYVWLGVEIANNSQLSCKTFVGRCLVLHRTLQLQRELCLSVSVLASVERHSLENVSFLAWYRISSSNESRVTQA